MILIATKVSFSKAQNIVAAEYFLNSDPGVGNGIAISVPSPAANVNLVANLPTATLANGFHVVSVRAQQTSGAWGLAQKAAFYISSSTTNVGNIAAAEYFIDSDPGVGNGTAVTVTSGANVNFVATVPTTSFGAGFHAVSIRTKDVDGKWSLFERSNFYISSNTNNVGNIVAAEYFVDTDPGFGNANAVSVTAGANVNFVATVSTASLTPGFHFVAIRTRVAEGKWSLFEKASFYISSTTTNTTNIVAAEYFVDADPGLGNGVALSVTAGTNVNFVATVPTTTLTTGFHTVAIRVRAADGKWGLFEKASFYISTQTTNSAGMTAAEYFLDTDPGVGNGAPFTIPGGQSFNQNFALLIPVGTTQGQHFIAVRTKNDWGLIAFDTVNVSGTVVPLKLLSFDAFKQQSSVLIKWKTDNELNTSHFDIERSTNGTQFEKIETVSAVNAQGVNNYAYEDAKPFTKLNYYRIKQIDNDGKTTYSTIAKVLFDQFGKPLHLYPNPATDMLQFEFASKQKTVLVNVFDVKGRLLQTSTMQHQPTLKLPISKFPKGKYMLQLSDGEQSSMGSFIKQ